MKNRCRNIDYRDLALEPKKAYKDFVREGVAPATRKRYAQRWRTYAGWCKRGRRALGPKSLIDFLRALEEHGAAGDTAEGYRSAVAFRLRVHRHEPWASGPKVTELTACMKHASRRARIKRGGISEGMLAQLASLDRAYAVAFKVAFYGTLRGSQLIKIRCGDFTPGEEAKLLVRVDKRFKKGGRTEHKHEKPMPWPEMSRLMGGLQGATERGDKLFAWFSRTKARELIKEAAAKFNWPANVEFDGIHTLRHGGAQMARDRFEHGYENARQTTAMSKGVYRRYSKRNVNR